MVTRFGMSERVGQLTYEHTQTSVFLPTTGPQDERLYSQNTAEMIDHEIRHISDHIYHRVQSILSRRLEDLHVVAEALIRKETLTRAEIDVLLSRKDIGLSGTSDIQERMSG
jgi:cell division protease FtsH